MLKAFREFDPYAFLEREERRETAAKPAKAAKAPEREPEPSATLATLAALAGGQTETQNFEVPPDTWTDAQEERAAIVEYDGGAPRTWAEALARLDPSKPPGDVPSRRWLRFIDDCGRFLDGGWAERAAAFGWGRSICSAAIVRDPSLASITWDCSGCSTAAASSNCIATGRSSKRRAVLVKLTDVGPSKLAASC